MCQEAQPVLLWFSLVAVVPAGQYWVMKAAVIDIINDYKSLMKKFSERSNHSQGPADCMLGTQGALDIQDYDFALVVLHRQI